MEWRGLGTGRKYVELRDAVLKYCLSNPFTRQQGWERKSGIERVREEGDFKYFQKEKKNPKKPINALVAGDVKAKEPPTQTRSCAPAGKAGTPNQLRCCRKWELSGLDLKPTQGCSA